MEVPVAGPGSVVGETGPSGAVGGTGGGTPVAPEGGQTRDTSFTVVFRLGRAEWSRNEYWRLPKGNENSISFLKACVGTRPKRNRL